ncbi:MAG: biotin/lipoyl-binding protein, partial [Anaerolineae bacterium]|nr:biotin/lipoyl-binding protein [Anaerolineae bacterium]
YTERGNKKVTVDGHWRNNPYRAAREKFKHGSSEYEVLLTPKGDELYEAQIGDKTYRAEVWSFENGDMSLALDGHRQWVSLVSGDQNDWWIHVGGQSYNLKWISPLPEAGHKTAAEGSLHAPMPGQIRAVNIAVGQKVVAGDTLMILEAMKMEHRIKAPYAGEVAAVNYQVGQQVQADAILLELKATE